MRKIIQESKVKDMLIGEISQKLNVPIEWTEIIISHQFKDVNDQIRNKHEIEISGLGKLKISRRKLAGRIRECHNMKQALNRRLEDPNSLTRELDETKLMNVLVKLDYLNRKNQKYEN